MKGTDLSNEEIADIVGYGSTTNYYKAFRRYYGMSPREYAASHRTGGEEMRSMDQEQMYQEQMYQ